MEPAMLSRSTELLRIPHWQLSAAGLANIFSHYFTEKFLILKYFLNILSIPGVPGEDYPIYAEVPETAFSCDGQVDGGE